MCFTDRASPMLSCCKKTRKTVTRDEEGRGDLCLCLDIIVEILKKLPAKSLVRFRSVSKQWSTIIGSRRDFIESIVARSLRQPPLELPIFIFHHCVPETFFTVSPVFSPTPTDHVVTIPRPSPRNSFHYQYSRGLICCSSSESHLVTIYNPTTRQLFPLPEIQAPATRSELSSCFFGYDPITNQYKVLSIVVVNDDEQSYHVFTLGCQQSWRKVKGIDEESFPNDYSVCIDGTIYYNAKRGVETMLLSFDIRSERFDRSRLVSRRIVDSYV
ncbi:unnamed protein product [Eruca vesicaria subsp. sativa]|uniref:F-box domain-containing protein n=1 Tax=Eruca vesicaria subsp. sativa TaxID=29727 RepID=A0ABC8JAD4_ERUVS|nr:unnamed protein product [Eruca vesicaria subsp. sativa]